MFNRFIIFIFLQMFKLSNQLMSLTLDQATYAVYANIGSTLTMTCTGVDLTQSDIVWKYYLIGNNASITTIYVSNQIARPSLASKFTITNTIISANTLVSSLTFNTISVTDANYIYQCACNIYTACPTTAVSASASIEILTTTTSTTTTTTTSTTTTTTTTTSTTSTTTTTTTTTPTTSTTTTTTTTTTTLPPKQWCIDGNYNTAQYVLIILCNIVILVATLLFHFSFHGSLVETFFLALLLIISVFCIITSLIFWINPELAGDKSFVNVIIVSCGLFSLVLQWILIIQYGIRLALSNEIKSFVIALVCIDGVLEAVAGGVIILANLYCTGKSTLPSIAGFNYSYVEIIGAIVLVIFALVLLLISGVIFFIRKKNKDAFMFNNLKALSTGVVSPLHYQGIFVPHSSAATAARPPARIHEMWFANQSKIEAFDDNDNNNNNYPPKPAKLTPLYARKRSEISNIDTGLFSRSSTLPKLSKKNTVEDSSSSKRTESREKLKPEISSDLNDSLPNEEKKPKKKKIKKKDISVQPIESDTNKTNNDSNEINTTDLVEAFDNVETLNSENESTEVKQIKSNDTSSINDIKNINNKNIITETLDATGAAGSNSIDSIWNTNLLQPKIDESMNLGTINEEFADSRLNRSRILGARRVKTGDQEDTLINRENTDISLRLSSGTKRAKSIDFFKSLNQQNSFEDDDNIILVDEFNRRENQTSSSNYAANLNRRSSTKND